MTERTRPTSRTEPADATLDVDALLPGAFDAAGPLGVSQADAVPGPLAETVGESDAREVWRVAARLQAEAARRLDARSQAIAGEHRADAPPQAAVFSRVEVEEIAQAAGIDPSFVALAWREVEATRHLAPVSDERQRRASAYLGMEAERLGVTRTFRAAPDKVLASMQRVLPADPFRLTLIEVLGESDELTDSALLFDVPKLGKQVSELGRYTEFSYGMSFCDLTRLVVTLHDLGDGRTEATVSADLRPGKSRNLTHAFWTSIVVACLAGALGGWAGLAASGATAAVMVAVLAAVVVGALAHRAYPAAYRGGLGKGERALADLLGAVDLDLRSGGAFRSPTAPPPPSEGGFIVA